MQARELLPAGRCWWFLAWLLLITASHGVGLLAWLAAACNCLPGHCSCLPTIYLLTFTCLPSTCLHLLAYHLLAYHLLAYIYLPDYLLPITAFLIRQYTLKAARLVWQYNTYIRLLACCLTGCHLRLIVWMATQNTPCARLPGRQWCLFVQMLRAGQDTHN